MQFPYVLMLTDYDGTTATYDYATAAYAISAANTFLATGYRLATVTHFLTEDSGSIIYTKENETEYCENA